ncbi:MAG: hypothetical protein ACYC5H_01960 [Methylovirgula sp.]
MTKLTNTLAAFGFMTLTFGGIAMAASPASASSMPYYPSIYSGMTPDSYDGPLASHEDYASVVRAVNGTPCGIICTRDREFRWGYAPQR